MLQRFSVNFTIFSLVFDMALTALSLWLAALVRPLLPPSLPLLQPLTPYEVVVPTSLYVVFPVIWDVVFLLTSVYEPQRVYEIVDEIQQVVLSSGVATLSCAGLLYLTFRNVSRWLFISFVLFNFLLLVGWRMIARVLWRSGRSSPIKRRILIAGAGEVGQRVAKEVERYTWAGLNVLGYLDDRGSQRPQDLAILGSLDEGREVVQRHDADDVVIALPRRAYVRLNQLVADLHDLPVQVWVVPDYFSLALYRADVRSFAGMPMVDLRAPALDDVQRLIKRIFDLTVGLLATLVSLPIMILIAIAIKLDSSGPVLFSQTRVGENGQLFVVYKFRSMYRDADSRREQVAEVDGEGHVIHKHRNDPRVTPVGRFLRRFSLDELPQLFNVLKGEMSLVGPRPELPWLVERYESWQRKRFTVPPGLTGWWQVNGRSDRPMHLHTEDDLYYIQNYSLLFDLFIIWRTVWAVLRGKGAY